MAASIRTVIDLFKIGDSFFVEKIGNLDKETAGKRVSDNTNSILWIAGHLCSVRAHLLELVGGKVDVPWEKQFQEKFDPSKDYPEMATIRDLWVSISDQLFEKVESATEDALSKDLEYELPHGNNTVRGAIIFFAYHEAWHLGQIAYARKCMDMEGLVPY